MKNRVDVLNMGGREGPAEKVTLNGDLKEVEEQSRRPGQRSWGRGVSALFGGQQGACLAGME